MLAAKPSEDPGGVKGQLELLRRARARQLPGSAGRHRAGSGDALLARRPIQLPAQPQENFARELMELFTMGVGTFAETDVYAGARVFTGWNLTRPGAGDARRYAFNYNAAQHDTGAKTFTFPIYPGGRATIPARRRRIGHAGRPRSDQRRRRASRDRAAARAQALRVLHQRSRSAGRVPRSGRLRGSYYARGFAIEPMVRRLLLSSQFRDPANYYKRYSWPVEFVARALKEVGWDGLLGERRADAAREHGAAALRAAGRERLGARAGLVLERRDAGANELRVAADHESEVQPARRGRGRAARRRSRSSPTCSIA